MKVSEISEKRKLYLLENVLTKKVDHKSLYSEYLELLYDDLIEWHFGTALLTEEGETYLRETLLNLK